MTTENKGKSGKKMSEKFYFSVFSVILGFYYLSNSTILIFLLT